LLRRCRLRQPRLRCRRGREKQRRTNSAKPAGHKLSVWMRQHGRHSLPVATAKAVEKPQLVGATVARQPPDSCEASRPLTGCASVVPPPAVVSTPPAAPATPSPTHSAPWLQFMRPHHSRPLLFGSCAWRSAPVTFPLGPFAPPVAAIRCPTHARPQQWLAHYRPRYRDGHR
jgi:hypothetical protein